MPHTDCGSGIEDNRQKVYTRKAIWVGAALYILIKDRGSDTFMHKFRNWGIEGIEELGNCWNWRMVGIGELKGLGLKIHVFANR
jgi:hypothetical protein